MSRRLGMFKGFMFREKEKKKKGKNSKVNNHKKDKEKIGRLYEKYKKEEVFLKKSGIKKVSKFFNYATFSSSLFFFSYFVNNNIPPNPYIDIPISAIALYLSGYFSSSETAVSNVSTIFGRKIGLLNEAKDREKLIAGILLGNNVVNIVYGVEVSRISLWMNNVVNSHFVNTVTSILSYLLSTFLLIVAAEIIPKVIAVRDSENLVEKRKDSLNTIKNTFGTVHMFFEMMLDKFYKPRRSDVKQEKIIDVTDYLNIDHTYSPIIKKLVDFSNYRVEDIMVRLEETQYLSVDELNKPLKEVLSYFEEKHGRIHSRIPVVDLGKNKVVGVLKSHKLVGVDVNKPVKNYMSEFCEGGVNVDSKIESVYEFMLDNKVKVAPVFGNDGKVVGFVFDGDLVFDLIEIRDRDYRDKE